jgi:hypothetical protein
MKKWGVLLLGAGMLVSNLHAVTFKGSMIGTFTESFSGAGSSIPWQTGIEISAGDQFVFNYTFESDGLSGTRTVDSVFTASILPSGTQSWDSIIGAPLTITDGHIVAAFFTSEHAYTGGPGIGRLSIRLDEGEQSAPFVASMAAGFAIFTDPIPTPDGGSTAVLLGVATLGVGYLRKLLSLSPLRRELAH